MEIQTTVNQITKRIIEFRKDKNYTLENMAEELGISVAAYNKIEKNETKLTLERLFQIQKALNVKLHELIDVKSDTVYNQEIRDSGVGHQEVKTIYQYNKDQTETFVSALKEEISFLREQFNKK